MNYTTLANNMINMDESELEETLLGLKPNPKLLADFYNFFSKKWDFGIPTLDIVGTGGDGKNSFNISTASSIVLASLGVPVVKFGNRAATSISGSVDVLRHLGIKTFNNPEQALENLTKNGICFVNARDVYPEFSKFANVRKKIGKPTIFNYLGPLLNPLIASYSVLGVYHNDFKNLYLETFRFLGKDNFAIVNGNGYDEAVPFGFASINFTDKRRNYILPPYLHGTENDLVVTSPKESAEIIRNILFGQDCSVRRECVVLNSAIAYSCFLSQPFERSEEIIRTYIANGKASCLLSQLSNI